MAISRSAMPTKLYRRMAQSETRTVPHESCKSRSLVGRLRNQMSTSTDNMDMTSSTCDTTSSIGTSSRSWPS